MQEIRRALVEGLMVPATVLRYGGCTDCLALKSLTGGQGRTLKVLLGTLLIMLVGNGLNLMQVGAYAQTMAIGAVLVFAMAVARR